MIRKSALIIFFLIFLDQFSKYIIRFRGGFYVCNKYLALGINFKYNFVLILLALALLTFFFNSKFKNQNAKFKFKIQNYFPFLLIISGGIANIIDRLRFGCVIDFIDVGFWPVFNIADSFIVIGVIIILVFMLKKKVA